jgi:hypothetical protein
MYKEVRKAASGSFTNVDLDKREVVTQFATYGTRDRDRDQANQGMFTKSWNEFKDVRVFKNHQKELAPGKILKLWDDEKGASSLVKMGRDTLGNDTLLQIQDEIITDSSYLFVPMKGKAFNDGGYNYTEVFHKEVSFLTHWGAHPESKIKAVAKAAGDFSISEEVLKELSTDEVQYLRNFITGYTNNLQDLITFSQGLNETSDLWVWVNDMISRVSEQIANFKYKIMWYGPKQKAENNELIQRLAKLKSFCKNSTASDECIQNVLKEADYMENLLSGQTESTQSSGLSTQEQQKGANDSKLLHLQLLNLSMQLER